MSGRAVKTIFLCGEGKTDIGDTGLMVLPGERREGVVQTLIRRVLGADENAPVEVRFHARKVSLFPKDRRKPRGPRLEGDARRAYLAYQLAQRHGDEIHGFVMVRDADATGAERREQMRAAVAAARESSGAEIPAVCGLAIQTIEAWVLAALPPDVLAQHTKRRSVEALWGKKGARDSMHPCDVCARVLDEIDRHGNNLEGKVALLEDADLAALEERCPDGFAPFASELREAFASWLERHEER